MKEIIDVICHLLNQGEPIVLATIIDHEGSTPRSTGSKMIVRRDGRIIGTIGGGLVEGQVLGYAEKVFQSRHASVCSFDMTNTVASDMGMICGGKLDILLEYVSPDPDTVELFETVNDILREGRRCILSTELANPSDLPAAPRHCLLLEDGGILGDFPHSPEWLDGIREEMQGMRFASLLDIEGCHFFLEPLREPGFLVLFGAGHVSQQTAVASLNLEFRIRVLDDRDGFASRDRFPEPIELKVLDNFDSCMEGLSIDDDSYLVIVTRGHLHDKVVLSQALRTGAGYIGMIGSRRKRDALYKALLGEGFRQTDIDRVHCPIGLSIGAETPEEIAISILSELIQVRAGK
jgi:xanthine dehydrogenase accessory factor